MQRLESFAENEFYVNATLKLGQMLAKK